MPLDERNDESEEGKSSSSPDSVKSRTSKHIWFHRPRLADGNRGSCFVCAKAGGQLLSCGFLRGKNSNCDTKFHPDCIKSYNCADYDISILKELMKTDDIVCPLHYCDLCFFERQKYSALTGKLVECDACMRAFHFDCRPAGVQLRKNNKKEYTRCHSHSEFKVKIPVKVRVNYCCECELTDSPDKLIRCSTCMFSFHKECVKSEVLGAEGRGEGPFCEACIIGDSIRVGQSVVTFYENKYYAAKAIDWESLPPLCRKLDRLGKNLGEPGFIPVRWAGCTNMYNICKADVVVPIFEGASLIFPIDKDKDFMRGWMEEEKAEPCRPSFPYKDINRHSDKYTVIKTTVYHPGCPRPALIQVDSDTYDNCSCPAKEGEERCLETCGNRSIDFECPKSCTEKPGKCMNRGISEKIVNPAVEKKLTEKKGYGLFATKAIKGDSFIAEYAGELITREEEKRRTDISSMMKNNEEVHYMMNLDNKRTIDSKFKGNIARFINHSCNPNCKVTVMDVPIEEVTKKKGGVFIKSDKRAAVISLRDIAVGEELSFDYQMEEYAKCKPPPCLCGSDNCKGQMGVGKEKKEAAKTLVLGKGSALKAKRKISRRKAVVNEPKKKKPAKSQKEKKNEKEEDEPIIAKKRGRPLKVRGDDIDTDVDVAESPVKRSARMPVSRSPLRTVQLLHDIKKADETKPVMRGRGRPPLKQKEVEAVAKRRTLNAKRGEPVVRAKKEEKEAVGEGNAAVPSQRELRLIRRNAMAAEAKKDEKKDPVKKEEKNEPVKKMNPGKEEEKKGNQKKINPVKIDVKGQQMLRRGSPRGSKAKKKNEMSEDEGEEAPILERQDEADDGEESGEEEAPLLEREAPELERHHEEAPELEMQEELLPELQMEDDDMDMEPAPQLQLAILSDGEDEGSPLL